MRDVQALPKADLHVHLEGSMRVSTLLDLAERHGAPIPSGLRARRWRFRGPAEFIEQYGVACGVLQDLDDFRRIAVELCEDEAREGVGLAEVTFSPSQHASRLGDWDGPTAAVLDGLSEGVARHGVHAALVLDVVRDFGLDPAEATLGVALKRAGEGVVALGCAGSERFPAEPFADVFDAAIKAGLHSVPHAGEWSGAQGIRTALRGLHAERIGHGIRCLEDPDVVEELRDRRIPLEVCPTSNLATGAVASLAAHPFPEMRAAGLNVTLNSDDPAMFDSPLAHEYRLAREAFDLDDLALAHIARAGVSASFAPAALKAEMQEGIDAWLDRPG